MKGLLVILLSVGVAQAQNVAVRAEPTTAVGMAAPVVTWVSTPAASSCSAGGAWSGAKPAGGTETQPSITTTSTYSLTCAFPGSPDVPGSALVAWEAPATNRDGTPYSNPGSYRIDYGTTPELLQTTYVDSPDARWHRIDNLAPGLWYFAVRAVNALGFESDRSPAASLRVGTPGTPSSTASGSATVTITSQPVMRVVAVIAGVDHSPVFTVLSGGVRSATVGGMAAVGTECTGPVLFRYRSRDWYRPATFKPWGVAATANVAAPCALSP